MVNVRVALLALFLAGCAPSLLGSDDTDVPFQEIDPPTVCVPSYDRCCVHADCPHGEGCLSGICIPADPEGEVCEFRGECTGGEVCLTRCTVVLCDPMVDPALPCYSGEPGTEGIGRCHSGFHYCMPDELTGVYSYSGDCIGEVVGRDEVGFLACNGLDDDCDGETDTGELEEVDLIFAFDISGSMAGSLLPVATAMGGTATMYNDPRIRIGLIYFPNPVVPDDDDRPVVMIELVPYADFIIRLGLALTGLDTYGASEASFDVPYMVANNLLPALGQRPSADQVVVMFTDERGQSYNDIDGVDGCLFDGSGEGHLCDVDEEIMCQAVNDNDVRLYTFVNDNNFREWSGGSSTTTPYSEFFDDCSTIFYLSRDHAEMVDNMTDLVDHICQQE